ncbi:MAG TPA: HemK2/MTQ2 family protein methyltransferase [Pseudonocardiaceae bacterium]|nr:HemK2/MTQ2 family protein methyltransferase [Pseudonocardiaceae bacterium]
MCLIRPPGVYPVDSDTTFLIEVLHAGGYAAGRRVLDVGTGTGALALAAARAGAASVTAVDLSLRSVAAAWLNSRLRRVACTVRWGDLCGPVAGQQFDLILANPPYVPAAHDALPRHRISRCWDGGLDGRLIVDRLCAEGPDLLAPEGMILVVHSALCDEDITLKRFADTGLQAEVVARCTVPFGPVMRARATMLEARGLVESGQREEELVIIRAHRGCLAKSALGHADRERARAGARTA